MNSDPVLADDEFEYEYDDHETETFLVDLDLSSLNTVIKPNIPGATKLKKNRKKANGNTNTPSPEPDELLAGATPQNADTAASPVPAQTTAGNDATREQNDADLTMPSNVQVLGLYTTNPVVSYHDQVYSCTWVDLIGTNMLFTQPGASEDVQPVVSTDDCDLLGMSTIKLLGHRTIMKKSSRKRDRPEDDGEGDDNQTPDVADTQPRVVGRSLGTLTGYNSHRNVQIKRQAAFLEKLAEIKDKRGHQDTVRTYVDEKIASHEPWKFSKSQSIEIDDLNRRVGRGEAEALERLQTIYSQLEEEDNAMEPNPEKMHPD